MPGRRGGHERLGERCIGNERALGVELGGVGVGDGADRRRGVHQVDLHPLAAGEGELEEVAVLEQVAHQRPPAGVAEPGHAVLHVREEALARLLAVVAAVDAGRELAGDDVGGGGLDRGAQLGRVDVLAAAAAAVERGELGRARQAAGVGDDEAVAGGEHRAVRRAGSAGRWPARPSRAARPAPAPGSSRRRGGRRRSRRRARWRRPSTTTPRGRCRRVGEVHGPDEAVVDDVGDLAPGVLEAVAQGEQRLLVGQVERQVVELDRSRVGHAGRLGERLDLGVGVLEEGDRALLPEGEEVVPEARRADRRHELGTEHAVVEAHRRVHVVGDEGEVVDAPPVQCRIPAHALTLALATRAGGPRGQGSLPGLSSPPGSVVAARRRVRSGS